MRVSDAVERHYAVDNLLDAIRDGLARLGKDSGNLTLEDLAPVDEFHVRGRAATLEMGKSLGLGPDRLVLDIGCGLGGPSRLLASEYGCRVSGIDLTAAYCDVARALGDWVGLSDLVDYRKADALDLPFGDASFDAAITQHVAMNIADKGRMYDEAARVLKPEAAFAIYDVLAGEGGAPHYPLPWARDGSTSFLATPVEMERYLHGAGFEIAARRDVTAMGLEFFQAMARRRGDGGSPPLGFHLLMGDDFAAMAGNMQRNLAENRVALMEFICRAPEKRV